MLDSFAWFLRTDLRNKVQRRLARLRSPKYAIALLVGFAYFFLIFDGEALFRGEARPDPTPGGGLNVLIAVTPFLLALLAAKWWLFGGARRALAFLPAEVNFLFTAPVTRRQLIQFKLLRAQPALLFSAFFFTLIMRGSPAPWWLRFPSMWLLVSTIYLHQIAAELVHASAREHGRSGWRRAGVPIVLFALGMGSLVWSLVAALPLLRAAQGQAVLAVLRDALAAPPASIALAPFRLLVMPMEAIALDQWIAPFALGLLVLLAHYFWIVRLDVAFEESAAEAGAKVAALAAAIKAGRHVNVFSGTKRRKLKRPWFGLSASGEPAVAILWKNVLYATRNSSMFVFMVVLTLVPIAFIGVLSFLEDRNISTAFEIGGIMLLSLTGALFFFGPLGFRNDLRMDLKKIELLRTLPLDGDRMVASQLAASTSAMTLAQLAFLVPGAFLLWLSADAPPNLVLVTLLAILVLPALNAIALGIQNGMALVFPAWSRIGADQVGGIEHMGQQIMTVAGATAVLILALIPPLLAGAVAGGVTYSLLQRYAFIPGALAATAALYGEVVLMIGWLGEVYDRLDPVEAGLCR